MELVASAAPEVLVVLAATPPTASTEMVVLVVLVVEQARAVKVATEALVLRLQLVALAEPAELLEHRVAVELVAPRGQGESAVRPE